MWQTKCCVSNAHNVTLQSDNILTVTFVIIITLCHQIYANQLQTSEQINCLVLNNYLLRWSWQ